MEGRCPACQAELPEGAQFCIECGHSVVQAATGPTQVLTEHASGLRCTACSALNPAHAVFCVSCGRPLGEQSAVSTEIAPRPLPTVSAPTLPSPQQSHPTQSRPNQGNQWLLNAIPTVIFFIGLAILARFGWWWPGIMVLIGTVSLLGSALNGQLWAGVQSAIWMFGIAIIARFNWWWPGMFILVGLSAILGAIVRPGRRVW